MIEDFNQINKRIVNKDDIFITKDKKVYTTSNLKGKLNLKNESFVPSKISTFFVSPPHTPRLRQQQKHSEILFSHTGEF